MAEYIEREALIRDLIDNYSFYPALVKNVIERQPAADVAEVVRCKDCNNSAEVACGVMFCCYFNKNVEEDDYCSNWC